MIHQSYIIPYLYHPWGFNGVVCQTLAYCLEQTRHILHQPLLDSSVYMSIYHIVGFFCWRNIHEFHISLESFSDTGSPGGQPSYLVVHNIRSTLIRCPDKSARLSGVAGGTRHQRSNIRSNFTATLSTSFGCCCLRQFTQTTHCRCQHMYQRLYEYFQQEECGWHEHHRSLYDSNCIYQNRSTAYLLLHCHSHQTQHRQSLSTCDKDKNFTTLPAQS